MLIAGYLHDIGKISIDPGIIGEFGPLISDKLFGMVDTHRAESNTEVLRCHEQSLDTYSKGLSNHSITD